MQPGRGRMKVDNALIMFLVHVYFSLDYDKILFPSCVRKRGYPLFIVLSEI